MRKWWKRGGIVTGGLLGLGSLLASAQPAWAQFSSLPPGNGIFAADPQPPVPAEFPNPGKPGTEPVSPFSVKDEGMPNAFTILESPLAQNPYNLTFRGEYLSWFLPRISIPTPLLTTSSDPAVTATTGLLGAAGTNILVPQGNYSMGLTDGYRFTMGVAPGFTPPIEGSGLFFTRNSTLYNFASNGTTFLVRPVQVTTASGLTGARRSPDSSSPVLASARGFSMSPARSTCGLPTWTCSSTSSTTARCRWTSYSAINTPI